jgi:DNA-binding transcriptional LysR family regulator
VGKPLLIDKMPIQRLTVVKIKTIENVSLRSLQVLQSVAERGSFAEAGRQLGLQRAVVSQLVAQLEAQLDTKVFKRTTRKVALTEDGEALVARIAQPLAEIRDSLQGMRAQSASVAGTVRLSVSHALGRHGVLPALPAFAALCPEVQVEVLLADRLDDLISQNLDLTVRMGDLPDNSMVARKLGNLDVCLVASSALVAHEGMPRNLQQLADLPAVGFRVPGTGALYSCQLELKGERHAVQHKRTAAVCNSIEGVADLVRMGAGVAAIPRLFVQADIDAGTVRPLMERYRLPSIPVHLYFTSRALMPKRVRLLADHLVKAVDASGWSNKT